MKTIEEFNEKYGNYLPKRHYGLDIQDEKLITVFDKLFDVFTQIPGFEYYQIKLKFGKARVYTNLGMEVDRMLEVRIDDVLKNN